MSDPDANYELRQCPECRGNKQIRVVDYDIDGNAFYELENCPDCEGYGEIEVNIRERGRSWTNM